jgi:FkbM family methyltransferase
VRELYSVATDGVIDPKVIVDVGAFAGYSTLFFLHKYPSAHVIAIEPEADSFEVCARNLEPYRGRVTLLQRAIWPEPAKVVVRRRWWGTSSEWASRSFAAGDEPDALQALPLQTILDELGVQRVDLLKMNTNSEEDLFSHNADAWLPAVRNMAVMLGDAAAEDTFMCAMEGYGFYLTRSPWCWACTHIQQSAVSSATKKTDQSAAVFPANGGFEEFRVAPARRFAGGRTPGATDVALHWKTVVCDRPFRVSLAVRTGEQQSGRNAFCLSTISGDAVPARSVPYVAIENSEPLAVLAGERWRIGASIRSDGTTAIPDPATRGTYVFMRLLYDDGSYVDLRTSPLSRVSGEYELLEEVVEIPATPPERSLQRATFWLYAWVENRSEGELPSDSLWRVVIDRVFCERAV